jgi:hypothetical protein
LYSLQNGCIFVIKGCFGWTHLSDLPTKCLF